MSTPACLTTVDGGASYRRRVTTGEESRLQVLGRLDDVIRRHCQAGSACTTKLPRLTLHHYAEPPEPMHDLYHPLVCFIVHGHKRSVVGQEMFLYERGDHFVNVRDQPALGVIAGADYTAATLELNPAALADLVTVGDGHRTRHVPRPACAAPASLPALEVLLRLLRLLDDPDEIPVLAAHIEFELLFRVLQGPCGPTLRAATSDFALAMRARPVVRWIRENLDQPLDAAQLARTASTSTTSLYRAFKAATATTPLQFQKRLRLEEARRLLITGRKTVDEVGRAVGYRSPSQFSREYRRQFGAPPSADASRAVR